MQKEIENKHRSISYDHLLFLSEMRLVYVKLNDREEEARKLEKMEIMQLSEKIPPNQMLNNKPNKKWWTETNKQKQKKAKQSQQKNKKLKQKKKESRHFQQTNSNTNHEQHNNNMSQGLLYIMM
jgi:hypothetical protein|mmetsp:Transcript_29185/g.31828  ORF Transcript_29185/g.31828 Transcript_29185/m.31828 type:complete len:124 (-) Transcript_29185:2785-3156(-)